MTTSSFNIRELVSELDFDLNTGDAIARRALHAAARELSDTLPIPFELTVKPQDGVGLYDYSHQVPDGYQVTCVDCVEYCGRCIEQIEKCDPCPHGYDVCNMDLTQIELHPAHRGSHYNNELAIRLHLKPKFGHPEIPEYYCRHADVLMYLARAILAEMPDRPWTNAGYAGDMRNRADGCLVSESVRQARNGGGEAPCATGDLAL